MNSKTNETALIPNRKQAMEIIPVAITSAKYPGNSSAAARERGFGRALFIGHFSIRFFLAALAIEFETNARGATFFSQNPGASCQRWIVPDVLSMSARQNSAPMMLVILLESCDLLLHRS